MNNLFDPEMAPMMAGVFIAVVVLGGVGALIGEAKGRAAFGAVMGLVLGPLGWAIVLCMPAAGAQSRVGGLPLLGWLLMLGGGAGAVYFAAFFDASVAAPEISRATLGIQRVSNIGLMQDRQIGVIVSLAAVVVGLLLVLLGRPKADASPAVTSNTQREIIPSQDELRIILEMRKHKR